MSIRVLEVFREPLANGGQESFIMNMYRNMDHEAIVMDFLTPFACSNPALQAEIESYGGQVFAFDHPFGRHENKAFKETVDAFLRRNASQYDAIHFHSGSTYALMEGPKLAARYHIPVRIVHSHCGGFANLKYRIIKAISVPAFLRYPTAFAACSHLAARWKFPASIIRKGKYTLFKNAVDLDRFAWDPLSRQAMRKELQVEDKIVLGHVGRFSLQKNHAFLLDIFAAFVQKHPNSVLLLAGEGELKEQIEHKVHQLHLEDKVRFLGLRQDIPQLMNAMDLFVLPSFFEGLPVVGVEAQATGLPVIASDQVTQELPVKELAAYLPLGKEALDLWIEAMENALSAPRHSWKKTLQAEGYEVHEAARSLQQFYIDQIRQAGKEAV